MVKMIYTSSFRGTDCTEIIHCSSAWNQSCSGGVTTKTINKKEIIVTSVSTYPSVVIDFNLKDIAPTRIPEKRLRDMSAIEQIEYRRGISRHSKIGKRKNE